MASLFDTYQLNTLTLKNRIVMPPMTRSRASQPGDIPNEMMAEYYAQRASAGLIISEGTQVCALGKGYAWTPGMYSAEQVKGWQTVTSRVHEAGGKIFAQLWHVGRVSHPANTGGLQPVAPSAIKAQGVKVFIDENNSPGFTEAVMPRAMTIADIDDAIVAFRQAAENALAAGFDGIELHAANGYLINQFIDSQSNARTDEYGGTLENRLRFLKEVVAAVSGVVPSKQVGVRLAPLTTLNGTVDDNPRETYVRAAQVLNDMQVGYIHIAEADWDDAPDMPRDFREGLRQAFSGTLIYAGKYTKEKADIALAEGWADLIAFGRPFVSNPDLPARLKSGAALAQHNPDTLFGGTNEGYTDYQAVT